MCGEDVVVHQHQSPMARCLLRHPRWLLRIAAKVPPHTVQRKDEMLRTSFPSRAQAFVFLHPAKLRLADANDACDAHHAGLSHTPLANQEAHHAHDALPFRWLLLMLVMQRPLLAGC